MSASLPMYGFERLDASKFNLDKYDGDSLRSWVVEFDFEYPKKLYNLPHWLYLTSR